MLRRGDRVAIVAPGGLFVPKRLKSGLAELRRLGLVPVEDRRLHNKDFLFAGTLKDRTQAVRDAFASDAAAIWCARGGYGAYAVAQELALGPKPKKAKPVIGYSDVTALQLLALKWGFPALHTPCVDRLGDKDRPAAERRELERALFDPEWGFESKVKPIKAGRARGTLTGGNLTLVTSSIGTAWEIETKGRILFLEDIGEQPYRLDRMLTQLRSAGKLGGLAAAVFGDFTDCGPRSGWLTVLRRHFARAPYPSAYGLRCGHDTLRRPLPLGKTAILETSAFET